MITINYVCGFANRLFQYSIANIIAKQHGLMLPASPIYGIPHSYKAIDGFKLEGEPEFIQSPTDVSILHHRHSFTRPFRISGLFQKANLYLEHQSKIRNEWLRLDSHIQPVVYPSNTDLVIHIRRGDYLLHNWGAPYSFYREAINSTSFNRIYIVTDDLHDPFLTRFQKFKPSIISSHYLKDFALLVQAKKLIMSPSTFSWWGAFLSDAEEIFFPVPQHGIWSPEYSQEVDLTLPAEYSQYKYINCNDALRLNTIERIYFERKYLGLKLQNQGIAGYLKGHAQSVIKLGRQLMQWNT